MRYPLGAFFFVLVLPPFAAHAVLVGKAGMVAQVQNETTVAQSATDTWRHTVITR